MQQTQIHMMTHQTRNTLMYTLNHPHYKMTSSLTMTNQHSQTLNTLTDTLNHSDDKTSKPIPIALSLTTYHMITDQDSQTLNTLPNHPHHNT